MTLIKLLSFLAPLTIAFCAYSTDSDGGMAQFYINFKTKLETESKMMDKKFFKKIFEKENITKLFEQVLEEEHTLVPQAIISKKVRALSIYPNENFVELDKKIDLIKHLSKKPVDFFNTPTAGGPMATWQSLIDMNEPFRSFNNEQQLELLMLWRELFRQKVQDYVAYRAGLKPTYGVSLTSLSAYDSNVNRAPDDNSAPIDLSGKDDIQQTFVFSFDWKPLINNKAFSKNWEFNQNINMVYLSQVAHKENEMAIINLEPKITRKLRGWLTNASLSYRYHNFYFDTNTNAADPDNAYETRHVQSFFDSHRLKLDLTSKLYGGFSFISSQKSAFKLSYESRSYTDPTLVGQNSDAYVIGVAQSFFYGSKSNSIVFSLDYSDYTTDRQIDKDFYYFLPSLACSQNYDMGWKFPIKFNQSVSYRYKQWDDYLPTGSRTEELTTINLGMSSQLCKQVLVMFNISETFSQEKEESIPVAEKDADQFKAMLGFTWFQ